MLAALVGVLLVSARPPRVEPLSFDSAARAVGEVARALGGEGRGLLEPYPAVSAPFLWLLRHFPERVRLAVIHFGMARTLGLPLESFREFNPEALFSAYTSRYPDRAYQAVVVGSPGGGVAHLAALLDAPLLPSCALVGARHRIDPDDLAGYLGTGQALALALGPGQGYEAIIHYDPIHDRDLISYAALVRVRLLSLPEIYADFIRRHLAPGGTIILVEGTYSWPQVQVGEGVWLQIGGLGGIPPAEYLSHYSPPKEAVERRESEWGCPEAFAKAVREFASENGYRLLELPAAHPTEYSVLALRAYWAAGAREEMLLLDCFTTIDARFCRETGIPPLHLPFLTRDALEFAQDFLRECPNPTERLFLLLHPTYVSPPDMVPLPKWKEALPGVEALVDERYWPADPYAPFAAARMLSRLSQEYRLQGPLFLPVAELEELI